MLFSCGFNDFTALVLSAVRANAVRHFGLVAIGALGVGRSAEGIVSAAGLRARVGVSAFRIRHGLSTFLISL